MYLLLQIISAISGGITDLSFDSVGYAWQFLNCVLTASYSVCSFSLLHWLILNLICQISYFSEDCFPIACVFKSLVLWKEYQNKLVWHTSILTSLHHFLINMLHLYLSQLTLRRVMDKAKQLTRSGSLNEVSMVLLNNLLSLPFAIFLILLFGEWQYIVNT